MCHHTSLPRTASVRLYCGASGSASTLTVVEHPTCNYALSHTWSDFCQATSPTSSPTLSFSPTLSPTPSPSLSPTPFSTTHPYHNSNAVIIGIVAFVASLVFAGAVYVSCLCCYFKRPAGNDLTPPPTYIEVEMQEEWPYAPVSAVAIDMNGSMVVSAAWDGRKGDCAFCARQSR